MAQKKRPTERQRATKTTAPVPYPLVRYRIEIWMVEPFESRVAQHTISYRKGAAIMRDLIWSVVEWIAGTLDMRIPEKDHWGWDKQKQEMDATTDLWKRQDGEA